jgi:hypothetical protein
MAAVGGVREILLRNPKPPFRDQGTHMIRKILIAGVAMAALSVAACKKPADANAAADATPTAAANTASDAANTATNAAADAKNASATATNAAATATNAAANAAPAGDMKADAAKK